MLTSNTPVALEYSTSASFFGFHLGTVQFLNYDSDHSIFMYLRRDFTRQSQLSTHTQTVISTHQDPEKTAYL